MPGISDSAIPFIPTKITSSDGLSLPESHYLFGQFSREQAMEWLAISDEICYLAQQQIYLSAVDLSFDADTLPSPAKPSTSEQATTTAAHPTDPMIKSDHSLEFEIQRDMGMIWRENSEDDISQTTISPTNTHHDSSGWSGKEAGSSSGTNRSSDHASNTATEPDAPESIYARRNSLRAYGDYLQTQARQQMNTIAHDRHATGL